jgi:hypothetical protein
MSGFTPGPWAVADDHPNRACVRITCAASADELASLYWAPSDPSEPVNGVYSGDLERMANARLIAAAPALLEALQPFVGHNSSEDTITITVRTADVTRARTAIAKATGQEVQK